MKNKESVVDYIDQEGFYTIENYDKKSSFSSFLSSISGLKGIPMWAFYINRGQAMSSIGIGNKNNSIMEFFPANEAYKMISTNGFRTFISINDSEYYEAFSVTENNRNRLLKIKNNEIKIIEVNEDLGLDIEITYFTVPNEDFAAMGRRLKIVNKNNNDIRIKVIDGLTSIFPYGVNNSAYLEMSNTLRSWMEAKVEKNVGIYKLRATTEDTTEVGDVENYYFYTSFDKKSINNIIVDPEDIFGYDTSLKIPINLNKDFDINKVNKEAYNKVPCAFSYKEENLNTNEELSVYSYIGYSDNVKYMEEKIEKIRNEEYFNNKIIEGNRLIDSLVEDVKTESNYNFFDKYIEQSYIDNILRGGYPIKVGKDKIYYVYSRKHGDLERDYNFFTIEPKYYSQGNGNFRDVNQNRRLDIYFHQKVGSENIKLFNNLIQLDGFNPLVIKGKKFNVYKDNIEQLTYIFKRNNKEVDLNFFNNDFTIGELYKHLLFDINLDIVYIDSTINDIIDISEEKNEVDFGEGFWSDHWSYNLDLIEEYLGIYPDKKKELLIKDKDYKFYNSPKKINKIEDRIIIKDNKAKQQNFLSNKEIKSEWVTLENGQVYKTNLFSKLVVLVLNKFASLDPLGYGVEMEGGKPGWNDAMNGLPGLLGSSMAETFELKRVVEFLITNFDVIKDEELNLPKEVAVFFDEVLCNLKDYFDGNINQVDYWNRVERVKDKYRESIEGHISNEVSINKDNLIDILNKINLKIDRAINELKDKLGKIPTYMHYQLEKSSEENNHYFENPQVEFLPLFLEGYVKYLKICNKSEKKQIYEFIKNSDIYDKELKMYKTSESLEELKNNIGRARGFTQGWLERESIFMHMEFKYLLEILKAGLYDEFYEEIKTILPPFMDEKVYGRSLLENSSFIASSVNPDSRIRGKGFIARLSGTTIEMLNIWKIMMTGHNLFKYSEDKLIFELNPILKSDFFKGGKIKTTILGNVKLEYINLNNKDTFGTNKGIIKEYKLIDYSNNEKIIYGDKILGEEAFNIRNNKYKNIIVTIN